MAGLTTATGAASVILCSVSQSRHGWAGDADRRPGSSPRAGDAERDATLARLTEASSRGELDPVELDERLGAALRATYVAELEALTADLRPASTDSRSGRSQATPRRRRPFWRRAGFQYHAVPYVLVNGMLVGIWAITGHGFFWPFFPIAGWGIGLGMHACVAASLPQRKRHYAKPPAGHGIGGRLGRRGLLVRGLRTAPAARDQPAPSRPGRAPLTWRRTAPIRGTLRYRQRDPTPVEAVPDIHHFQSRASKKSVTFVQRQPVCQQVTGHDSGRSPWREVVDRHIGEGERPAWAQHAVDLAQCLRLVGPVMEAEGGGHGVEAPVGKWKRLGGSPDQMELCSGASCGGQHPGRPVEAEERQPRPSPS